MSKYIKLFEDHSEYEEYRQDIDFTLPNVSHCIIQEEVHYNPWVRDFSKEYLTFNVIEDGTIVWKTNEYSTLFKTISYSLDNGNTWTDITSSSEGETINVNVGDKVLLKANNTTYADGSSDGVENYNFFGGTAKYNAEGNIMSLLYGDDYVGKLTLTDGWTFACLFRNSNIVNAENLIIPATELSPGCYYAMFGNAQSLETSPKILPALTLPESGRWYGCYYQMFNGCTSLTTAPELPATTLKSRCYYAMFGNCTSLVSGPTILPATTLIDYCYNYMFDGCASLLNAPVLPATRLSNSCYIGMFQNCTSLVNAPALPSTTLGQYCYDTMFKGCTSLEIAPELPAETLVYRCYTHMFQGCTSLNYIKAMFTTTPGTDYTPDWVNGVAASGTFVQNINASWTTRGVNGIPEGWTLVDTGDYSDEGL